MALDKVHDMLLNWGLIEFKALPFYVERIKESRFLPSRVRIGMFMWMIPCCTPIINIFISKLFELQSRKELLFKRGKHFR